MEIYNVTLCECCIGIACNGEWESHNDCTDHTPLSKLGPNDTVCLADNDPDPFYGLNCDGCDTNLSGNRFDCHYLVP